MKWLRKKPASMHFSFPVPEDKYCQFFHKKLYRPSYQLLSLTVVTKGDKVKIATEEIL